MFFETKCRCNILRGETVTHHMFCPKCGSQNSDETKFCRVCGTDLGNVMALIEGRIPNLPDMAEKQIELSSSALRGLIVGVGFLIVCGVSFAISTRTAVLGIFALAFAFFFLAIGISRMVHASALKKLRESTTPTPTPELSPGEANYIKPTRSLFETDDLAPVPSSVTESTTTHLDKKFE